MPVNWKGFTSVKNDIKSNILDSANGLYRAGAMDRKTLRELEQLCIPSAEPMNAKEIKKLRLRCKTSQAIFAAYLNTSVSTVQKWEQGQKQPGGAALRLLNIIDQKGLDSIL